MSVYACVDVNVDLWQDVFAWENVFAFMCEFVCVCVHMLQCAVRIPDSISERCLHHFLIARTKYPTSTMDSQSILF